MVVIDGITAAISDGVSSLMALVVGEIFPFLLPAIVAPRVGVAVGARRCCMHRDT